MGETEIDRWAKILGWLAGNWKGENGFELVL